jgi:hypothetical protein
MLCMVRRPVVVTPFRCVRLLPGMELLGLIAFVAVWFLVQGWLLPRLGVPT